PGFSGGYAYVAPADREEWARAGNRIFSRFEDHWMPFEAVDTEDLGRLCGSLHTIFLLLADQDVAAAVPLINDLLAAFPASPHISTAAPWSLHYHDHSLPPVAAWQIGCAAALGSFISSGAWQYIGRCEAERCDRVFIDDTKNRSRRFCSQRCQNRAKVRAYRLRAVL
ncbi:MAG TPA: CGNR zinc finger domain-containing protein, partial [Lacisediminihabitans sp.]|uniref:CGNR zinc finger domain-containing protein n=1 Tax=Lacisediminihabitans sp. TaxID=2787631 RepID=UPI002ED7DCF8